MCIVGTTTLNTSNASDAWEISKAFLSGQDHRDGNISSFPNVNVGSVYEN